jgi:hypothetical protein
VCSVPGSCRARQPVCVWTGVAVAPPKRVAITVVAFQEFLATRGRYGGTARDSKGLAVR